MLADLFGLEAGDQARREIGVVDGDDPSLHQPEQGQEGRPAPGTRPSRSRMWAGGASAGS